MKNLVLALSVLAASSAQAQLKEVITCSFTEPFLDVTYNPRSKTVKLTEAVMNESRFYRRVALVSKGGRDFDLRLSNGRTLLSVRHTGQGSDGMSDLIYPYEAELHGTDYGSHHPNGTLYGGCSTKSEPVIDPNATGDGQ